MKDCIFCKIIKGKIPSVKIWEDKNFIAILDLYPNTKGMSVVLPKKHYDSDVIEMDEKIYKDFFMAAKKVARVLKKGLRVKRVAMAMEGTAVSHAHIKLYPLHGVDKNFKPKLPSSEELKKRKFFKKYPGYLPTLMGPQTTIKNLQKVSKQIKSNK